MAIHGTTWTLSFLLIILLVTKAESDINTSEAIIATHAIVGIPEFQLDDDNTSLTKSEFTLFINTIGTHSKGFLHTVFGPCKSDANSDCLWKTMCPGIEEIFQQYSTNGRLSADKLVEALPVTLQTMASPKCNQGYEEKGVKKVKDLPTAGETWAYGFGFTSLVVGISNIGACLGPLMDKTFFQRLLQFLVAMGCGSLAATGLMVLIPEAFHMMSAKELLGDDYVWKATVAVFSIYFFFVCERILKTFFYTRLARKRKSTDRSISVEATTIISDVDAPLATKTDSMENNHGHSHGPPGMDTPPTMVSTLAWMVMAGDMIHNFVDGLAIGAAFSTDLSVGISVSLAVVCEELPHELADIAILLHSGVRLKKAILINFISACFIYMGLIIGIFLGSNVQSGSQWIFALAGGLFLYVPLVDMMPEMSAHLDQEMTKGGKNAPIVAFLHITGLVIGTTIIIMIVNVSKYIVV